MRATRNIAVLRLSGLATHQSFVLQEDFYLPTHWLRCWKISSRTRYFLRTLIHTIIPEYCSTTLSWTLSSLLPPRNLPFICSSSFVNPCCKFTLSHNHHPVPPPPCLAFLILRLHLRRKEKPQPQPQPYTPLSISSTDPLQSFPGIISSPFPCFTSHATGSHIYVL
jgi:hypothetical protein